MNNVSLIGRVTKDIEVRKTQTGLSVTSFSVACERYLGKGKEKGTDFINCVAWRSSADYLGLYANKGDLVSITGSIQVRNYDKDGKTVNVTEVLVDQVKVVNKVGGKQVQNQTEQPKQIDHVFQSFNNENSLDFDTGPALDITSDDLPF